jgi:UDP:flavonoid glycosyltransferase YjiC (YdhE family)
VLLATAGRAMPKLAANVQAAPYVRGDLACEAAAIVVCNGGASTAYQALSAGTPVVGLPLNLDQYLAMEAIERAQAGVLVRSGTATAQLVREAVERALTLPGAKAQMQELHADVQFRRFLREVF